ncbi:MAG: enoyl-CoA hydratase/isomerase family protein [Actinobacteria bacterium]|nr:enoyl-CoA hydratase/isomerase family protein [Actinomycetota bacterium]
MPRGQGGQEFKNLRSDNADGIASIVLDRPGHINAYTTEMYREIRLATRIAEADPEVAVIVFSAAGDVFGVGGDLNEMLEYLDDGPPHERVFRYQDDLPFATIRGCRKPTIAAIRGTCVGGGFGLATACDVVIAAEGTRVGIPEAKVGLIDGLAIARLFAQMPLPALKYLLFSGSLIDAREAWRLGLVLECVPADDLLARAWEVAAEFAATSPAAIRAYKKIFRSYDRPDHLDEMIELLLGDPEAADRMRALVRHRDDQRP